MKILNTKSLLATIDNFNEAHFRDADWGPEGDNIVEWMSGRLGKQGGYRGSFAMTPSDWNRDFRLFTGERITTRAGRSHIIAEEANRVLKIIELETGSQIPALKESEVRLGELIFRDPRIDAVKTGKFCCATCSVAMWRFMSKGGFGKHASLVKKGIDRLKEVSTPGGWGRYPFYYTLLALHEIEVPAARAEISKQEESCLRRLKILEKKRDKYSRRKRDLILRIVGDSL